LPIIIYFNDLFEVLNTLQQGNRLTMLPPSLTNCQLLEEGGKRLKLAGNPFRQSIITALQRDIRTLFTVLKSDEYQKSYDQWQLNGS
jgi:hypothetical protein